MSRDLKRIKTNRNTLIFNKYNKWFYKNLKYKQYIKLEITSL